MVTVGVTFPGVTLGVEEATELAKRVHISRVKSHGPLSGCSICGQVFTNHQRLHCPGDIFARDSHSLWVVQTLP